MKKITIEWEGNEINFRCDDCYPVVEVLGALQLCSIAVVKERTGQDNGKDN